MTTLTVSLESSVEIAHTFTVPLLDMATITSAGDKIRRYKIRRDKGRGGKTRGGERRSNKIRECKRGETHWGR